MGGVKLFLDDTRRPPPRFTHLACTARDAIALLESVAFEEVSLDYDLGPAEAGTGGDVARWMRDAALEGRLSPTHWRVHSANREGSQEILALLREADRAWGRREATGFHSSRL